MTTTDTWSTTDRDITRIEFGGERPTCRALQVESTPQARKVRVFMEPNTETDAAWQSLTLVLPDGYTVEIRGSDFYNIDLRRPDGTFAHWLNTDPNDEQPR